jgi:hypothetical protein
VSEQRIATAGITKRIYLGKISKDGRNFIGNKIDVTSDVINSLIEIFGDGKPHKITEDGEPKYVITIKPYKDIENCY